jgi:hypothetical protein
MDTRDHKAMVINAFLLHKLCAVVQKTIVEVFADDFIKLDDNEKVLRIETEELPF